MKADTHPANTLLFEGQPIPVAPGETVASALLRAGHAVQRITRNGEPRGAFCGIGLCHDCLVEIDGKQGQRACMTAAEGVMAVRQHKEGEPGPLRALTTTPNGSEARERAFDLVIVGAGPAGLAAALEATKAGNLSIALIDERAYGGGQYFKPGPHEGPKKPDRQHRAGNALRAQLAHSDVAHLRESTVWHAERSDHGIDLSLIGPSGAERIQAKAVILATGAYERPPFIPGWTLPGVMTIGAAQSLVRGFGTLPGRKVLIAGNGPLGLQLACEMIALGAPPLAIVERGSPSRLSNALSLARAVRHAPDLVARGAQMQALVRRAGVPVLEGWQLSAMHGEERVTQAEVEPVQGGGPVRAFDVDTVCVGEGFLPQAELARALGCACDPDPATGFLIPRRDRACATSQEGVWLVGDAAGLGGAQTALAEGEIAAIAALAYLSASAPDEERAKGKRAHAEGFQRALWRLYDAPQRPAPKDDVILCRCESVRFSEARQAIADGARDLGALKRLTRLGMGRCQGRYCGGPAAQLLRQTDLFAPQAPSRPVPIAALALEKPEWGGHRQSETPRSRSPEIGDGEAADLPKTADLVIIGAGIMGVAAALYASRYGLETVVLDRGAINGESSGGNAGSLHMQLLSFDFGAKTAGRSDALLQTLPLQRDAIALWQSLEHELERSFEIALTGGLMLAEKPEHIAFLEQKVADERRVGIDVEMVDRQAIQEIAPCVSKRMIAGAWCPGEGKINPLLATPALAAAARAMGARFVEGVRVDAIDQDRGSYRVMTSHGSMIESKRLILAAGGWTANVAAKLGVTLPVHGAPLQMIVTETAPQLAPCLLAHADRHLTMKQAAAGNIIIGGAWSAGTDAATGRARILRDSIEGNLWVAERVLPDLAGLHMLRSWAAMNVDIDGAPLIGPLPGHPGVVVVAGANGYTLGPLLGQVAAQCAMDGILPAPYRRFSPARFA